MDIGVVLQTTPPSSRVVDLAKKAEMFGFSHVWTFDSHILWQEPYVIFSQILAETRNVIVGPMVTNPATRDWTVTASTYATLNEMYGNRTVCGIGRGDSAVRVTNGKPTTLATLRESVHVIRELGCDLSIAEWTIKAVRDAAKAAGRDPMSIKICVAAPAYVGDDIPYMRDQTRWFGGMVGNHVADIVERYGENSSVPKALTDYIKNRQGYDYNEHGRAGNSHTTFVPDEIIDRFCILGNTDEHIRRLTELKDLGVDQFAVYLQHDGKEQTLEAYGEKIIPAIQDLGKAKQ